MKVALLGYLGVGKTALVNLLRDKRLPVRTTAKLLALVAGVVVEGRPVELWDFTGKTTLDYVLGEFLAGSDLVFVVVDSTPKVTQATRHLVALARRKVPQAGMVVVANKQDLPGAMTAARVATTLGVERVVPCSLKIGQPADLREKLLGFVEEIEREKGRKGRG